MKDFLLENGRLVLLGVVSYLLTDNVLSNLILSFVGEKLTPITVLQITSILTIILKGIDRARHENAINAPLSKKNEGLWGEKGITGF